MKHAPNGFIADLCIALSHRWEPDRLFVILTAYFDEAGTHGGDGSGDNPASPATIVGGLMANARQWDRFEDGIRKLQRQFNFGVIHSKDFKRLKGDKAIWGQAVLKGVGKLVATGLMEGVIFAVNHEEYKRDFIANRPRKPRLDSRYGLAFHVCLAHLSNEAQRRCSPKKSHILNVVVESGTPNIPDASRIFAEMREILRSSGSHVQFGTFSEAAKEDASPLMIADIVAHVNYQRAAGSMQPKGQLRTDGRRTGVAQLTIPGGLAELRRKVISEHDQRTSWGRQQPSVRQPS